MEPPKYIVEDDALWLPMKAKRIMGYRGINKLHLEEVAAVKTDSLHNNTSSREYTAATSSRCSCPTWHLPK